MMYKFKKTVAFLTLFGLVVSSFTLPNKVKAEESSTPTYTLTISNKNEVDDILSNFVGAQIEYNTEKSKVNITDIDTTEDVDISNGFSVYVNSKKLFTVQKLEAENKYGIVSNFCPCKRFGLNYAFIPSKNKIEVVAKDLDESIKKSALMESIYGFAYIELGGDLEGFIAGPEMLQIPNLSSLRLYGTGVANKSLTNYEKATSYTGEVASPISSQTASVLSHDLISTNFMFKSDEDIDLEDAYFTIPVYKQGKKDNIKFKIKLPVKKIRAGSTYFYLVDKAKKDAFSHSDFVLEPVTPGITFSSFTRTTKQDVPIAKVNVSGVKSLTEVRHYLKDEVTQEPKTLTDDDTYIKNNNIFFMQGDDSIPRYDIEGKHEYMDKEYVPLVSALYKYNQEATDDLLVHFSKSPIQLQGKTNNTTLHTFYTTNKQFEDVTRDLGVTLTEEFVKNDGSKETNSRKITVKPYKKLNVQDEVEHKSLTFKLDTDSSDHLDLTYNRNVEDLTLRVVYRQKNLIPVFTQKEDKVKREDFVLLAGETKEVTAGDDDGVWSVEGSRTITLNTTNNLPREVVFNFIKAEKTNVTINLKKDDEPAFNKTVTLEKNVGSMVFNPLESIEGYVTPVIPAGTRVTSNLNLTLTYKRNTHPVTIKDIVIDRTRGNVRNEYSREAVLVGHGKTYVALARQDQPSWELMSGQSSQTVLVNGPTTVTFEYVIEDQPKMKYEDGVIKHRVRIYQKLPDSSTKALIKTEYVKTGTDYKIIAPQLGGYVPAFTELSKHITREEDVTIDYTRQSTSSNDVYNHNYYSYIEAQRRYEEEKKLREAAEKKAKEEKERKEKEEKEKKAREEANKKNTTNKVTTPSYPSLYKPNSSDIDKENEYLNSKLDELKQLPNYKQLKGKYELETVLNKRIESLKPDQETRISVKVIDSTGESLVEKVMSLYTKDDIEKIYTLDSNDYKIVKVVRNDKSDSIVFHVKDLTQEDSKEDSTTIKKPLTPLQKEVKKVNKYVNTLKRYFKSEASKGKKITVKITEVLPNGKKLVKTKVFNRKTKVGLKFNNKYSLGKFKVSKNYKNITVVYKNKKAKGSKAKKR